MVSLSTSIEHSSQLKNEHLISSKLTSSSTADGLGTTKITPRPSPIMPTSLEFLLLSVYPTTLLVGSLFGLLDPAARNSTYNPSTQSHPPSTAPSYFAKKNNIFNIIFVKRGWAWVTLSYLLFLFSHPSTGSSTSLYMSPMRIRGLLRYISVTLWWIFVTQWFFGPPIIDRGFTLTGGKCDLTELTKSSRFNSDSRDIFVTSYACKTVGGQWKGGHDISGHVFLLVLGSMFLFEEVLHVALARRREDRMVIMNDGAIKSAETDSGARFSQESTGIWTFASKFAVGIAFLSLYMLLITAAYFHTWFEKFTGLTMAFTGIFVIYFLPRVVPSLRAILSMPGISQD